MSEGFVDIVKKGKAAMPEDEVRRIQRESAGYDNPQRNEDGSFKETDPRKEARTRVITPWYMPPCVERWEDVLEHLNRKFIGTRPTAYIFGGGSSPLAMDLRDLDGKFVYGINWTRKWFEPTMLQIMDHLPLRTQVIENKVPLEGVLVTSKTMWGRMSKKHDLDMPHVLFQVRDKAVDHRSFVFQEYPWEPLEHFSNSLGLALQIVYGLGFRKICLLGFDFGGPHFFGDGRIEGCVNHYGLAGEVKPDLHIKFLALAHVMRQHGCRIAQVGPTRLEWAFEQFPSLNEAHAYLEA